MRKAAIFKFIAKFIAAFFAILFVLTTILVLLLFNVEHTLLNAGTYKRALAENGVYEQLPALAGGEMGAIKTFLAKPCAENPLGCAIENASPELHTYLTDRPDEEDSESTGTERWNPTEVELQTLLTLLLPPDEARVMVENMLDQVSAYINGETDTARVSLVALKAHLTGQASEDLILFLLKAQPPCTKEELAQIHAGNAGDTEQPEFCNPPQQDLALLISQWQAQLDSTAAGIPDEAVIIKPPSEPAASGGEPLGNDPLATLNIIRMGIWFSPLLSLILLTLVTLFGIRSLKGWLRWWGIPLFITGLIVTVIGINILPMLDWAWVKYILPQFPSTFSAGITGLAHSLAGSVARDLANQITLEAAIVGLLGLAAIIGSFFVGTKRKEPEPLASTPEPKNVA